MAPLTKDSIEAPSTAGSTPVSQTGTQSKPTSSLRADALSLEVAVKVHGSRVIEVARGTAPRTEPFEEQTVTMIVFPQGAVLRMTSVVNVSQMLVLTNIKTKQDSICRVLKVRPNANQGSYVEVEFTHRQPGYWGVQFPSEGPVAANIVAPPQMNLESQTLTPPLPAPVVRPTDSAASRVKARRCRANCSIRATRETRVFLHLDRLTGKSTRSCFCHSGNKAALSCRKETGESGASCCKNYCRGASTCTAARSARSHNGRAVGRRRLRFPVCRLNRH